LIYDRKAESAPVRIDARQEMMHTLRVLRAPAAAGLQRYALAAVARG
jgi:hypothetical protein